jgi:hypothetical protein
VAGLDPATHTLVHVAPAARLLTISVSDPAPPC